MTDKGGDWAGIALGLSAALCWGLYNVGTEIGQKSGFRPADLTMLRFGGAALLLAPVLLVMRGQLPSLRRIVLLTLLVGPIFALLFNQGFRHAPLAHAVVIAPGVSMLTANLLSWRLDGTRPAGRRVTGMAILLAALVIIVGDQPAGTRTSGRIAAPLIGDLCFFASGTLWGIHVYLIGKWRIPPAPTTAAIALLSTLLFAPVYFAMSRPGTLSAALWAEQFVYQGLIGGTLAFVVFAAAVLRLGAARAAVFSAIVPACAVLMAIPLTDRWPSGWQWAGVLAATLGLLVSLDPAALRKRRRRATLDPKEQADEQD
ncbi:MAG: DMT family transporter [Paracoccus sp. (in: a-proteobacteria)]|nr:DMT family transporter [Paracoccus sp. (in: a-proteobacteria)]